MSALLAAQPVVKPVRSAATSREVRAGCFTCHGEDARWRGPQAQGTAARHHDLTGHPTWCDVRLLVRYGQALADPRQIDIEDSIAALGSGDRPEAVPLPVPDAPVAATAGVSARKGRSSRSALAAVKPEHAHA
ncbi:hypothetical protein [Sphingomonas profundi]|uniref:hypothetical protein n=1 Tax=Alterirhizorhabdus profundi TaxID=2681549 RepID=UPI0018D0C2B6|nr:hypothetical protein [Sphingomonas profundi]